MALHPHRLLIAILALALLPVGFAKDDSAAELFRKGRRAQAHGRHIEAYLLYSRARALDPANPKFAIAARGVRRGAARLLAASGEHGAALAMAPDSWEYGSADSPEAERERSVDISLRTSQPVPTQPQTLSYSAHETSFRFRGTLRQAYLEVAEEFGVRVIFDEGFEGDTQIRADLTECDFRCAIRALGEIGTVLIVPIDDDLLFVAEDTQSARSEFDSVAVASIPLDSGLSPDEVSEVAQAVQQVLDIKRLQAQASSGLVVRDSVAKVRMARLLAQTLSHPRGTTQIELHLVATSRAGHVRAGVNLPSAFPITNLSTLLGASPVATNSDRLIGMGGGKTLLGVTVGDASVIARLEAGSAQSLRSMQLICAHGMPAEFKVGERYPVASAQFSSGSSGTTLPGIGTGSYVQPPPSITFEDLGVSLSVTPLIHSALDFTLDLNVNFRFLSGSAVNDIPVLANREFQSQVRLRRGEFAIISGMTLYERRSSRAGLAGLGQIPLLGNLFRRNERRWTESDLLVLVRPRIARLPPGERARARSFLFGTEQRPVPAL